MTFGSFFKIAPHITDQKMCRGKNYMQEIYILHIFFKKKNSFEEVYVLS